METFRSTFTPEKPDFGLSHADRLLLLGSCFTENIGQRLLDMKFQAMVNPFGIVYNPVSMARSLDRLLAAGRPFQAEDLVQHAGLWHSWMHHGSWSGTDRDATLDRLNTAYHAAAAFLKNTNRLLLTLGTAEVFVLRETAEVVANCHKAPAALFVERRLGVDETVSALEISLQKLTAQVPDMQVILTVSPIRHLRNGPVANQRSKAVLVLACAELCARLPNVVYFPAYELLLDDLRDYRFYQPDLTHPSELAERYIWEVFGDVFFTAKTKALLARIERIRAAVQHRPFRQQSAEHQEFSERQLTAIAELSAAEPLLDFSQEIAHFRKNKTP